MMLLIRMLLYALFSGLAGYGIGNFDGIDTVTFSLDQITGLLMQLGVSVVGFFATFKASRIAKARGGKT